MRKSLLVLLTAMLLAGGAQAQKVMGYIEDYRYNNVTTQEYAALTDVIYSFLEFNTDGTLIGASVGGNATTVSDATFGWQQSAYATVKSNCKTKTNNGTGPRMHIALGGADKPGNRAGRFYSVCSNATYRAKLVDQVVKWAIQEGMYGIAIDWEFPATSQVSVHESFLHDLRAAINASADPSLILTIDVGGEYKNTVNHLQYVTATALTYIDELHIMSYDLPTSYSANHSTIADAKGAMTQWNLTYNFPFNKMVLGVPFYGWDASRNTTTLYSAESNYTTAYNKTDESATADGQYFNSKDALTQKVNYVYQKGSLGVVAWAVGHDRQLPDTYSLLGVLKTATAAACQAPIPNLGPDAGVCLTTTPAGLTLNSNVAAYTGRTFVWKKNGTVITGSSPTLSGVTTSGTYSVEVTQAGCTQTSSLSVTASTAVTATGGSVCGSGTVPLTVTSSGSNFNWFDASVGGTQLATGTTYSPNVTATTDFYVQDVGTSVTNHTGKAVMNNPSASLTPFGSSSATGHTDLGHKIVVSTSLKITSLDFTIAPSMTGSMSVNVVSSVDNKTILQTAGPFSYNNTSGTGQTLTLPVNLSLQPGTYYIMPVSTTGTNQSFWAEVGSWSATTLLPDYTVANVISVSANCFNDFHDGLGVKTPANAAYIGSLYNWVVVTGSANACGRTKVTATVNQGANTGLAVTAKTPAVCVGSTGTVTITGAESGISYQAYVSTVSAPTLVSAGSAVTGAGANLDITIPASSLSAAASSGTQAIITIKGTKTGCGTAALTDTATITLNIAPAAPGAITFASPVCAGTTSQAVSVGTVANATSYTWSYSGSGAAFAGTTASTTVNFTTGATSGNITVTATGACGTSGASAAKAVTVNAIPSVNPVAPNAICSGSTTAITLASTPAGATFAFGAPTLNGVTGGAAGTASPIAQVLTGAGTAVYSVTAALNGCTGTPTSISQTVKAIPTVNPVSPAAICSGTSTNIALTSTPAGATFSYATPTQSGVTGGAAGSSSTIAQTLTGSGSATYAVSATVNGCVSIPVNIVQNVNGAPAAPGAITGSSSIAYSASATTSPYSIATVANATSYTWSFTANGVTFSTSTISGGTVSTNATFPAGSASGTMSVTATGACGTSAASTKTVSILTDVKDDLLANGFAVSPNPSSSEFNLKAASIAEVELVVYNSLGQVVASVSETTDNLTFGAGLQQGVYFAKVSVSGKSYTYKLVKE